MNKSELIQSIAESADLSKAKAEHALNAFISTITDAMSKKDEVVLVGFGSFKVSERSARTGRNPQTGDVMQVPASKVVKFKVGKQLKDAVNGKKDK